LSRAREFETAAVERTLIQRSSDWQSWIWTLCTSTSLNSLRAGAT
jgi:hypothetical protein